MVSALNSRYIIDGVPQELTPAQILGDCGYASPDAEQEMAVPPIIDESVEPGIDTFPAEPSNTQLYLQRIKDTAPAMPVAFADSYTRGRLAGALIDAMWREGCFKLRDLGVKVRWSVNEDRVGNMAAFYRSVEAVADYLGELEVPLEKYDVAVAEETGVSVSVVKASASEAEDVFMEQPYRTENPVVGDNSIAQVLDPDPESWLIYIPFDTADYRLGGSLLARAMGQTGGVAPVVQDADYFLDCYEVVRELVEDGVAIAGTTVLEGGLFAALDRMTDGKTGMTANLSDMKKAFGESNPVRLLFSEVPGALIQIRDVDFDYVDAEMLLQDVPYFPLGHPEENGGRVEIASGEKTGIQNILDSLIRNQSAEGED